MNNIKNDITEISKSLEVISTNSTKIAESLSVKESKPELNFNEVLPYLTIVIVALIFSFTVLAYSGKLGVGPRWALLIGFMILFFGTIGSMIYLLCQ